MSEAANQGSLKPPQNVNPDQKTREGCGCPKFLAGKVFRQLSTLLENFPRFSGSTKCYLCQGLGTFWQQKWLLENWPRLQERCWIFSSETATAFLSFSDQTSQHGIFQCVVLSRPGKRKAYTTTRPSPFSKKAMQWGRKWPVPMNLPFFRLRSTRAVGGPESGRKKVEKCLGCTPKGAYANTAF